MEQLTSLIVHFPHLKSWLKPGRLPIQVVYDAFSNAETQNLGYDIVSTGGTLVITLPPALEEGKLKSDKSVYMVYGAPHEKEYEEIDAEFFKVLPDYLSSGDIKVRS